MFCSLLTALVLSVLALAGCGPNGPSWEALNSPQSNAIVSLAQDPSQPRLLYGGSNHGAIYRVLTDGTNAPISGAGLPTSAQTNAILPDPHAPGVLYAATTSGFFATMDYGDHWSGRGTGLPENDALSTLAFGTGGTLLAGTLQHGVYVSGDSGHTWTAANTGLPQGADIYILFHDPATKSVFAGLDGGGVYVSSDDGQTWTQHSQGLRPDAHVYTFAETPSKGITSTGPTLYAGTNTGIFASADGGQSWTQHGIGQGLSPGSAQALAADPKIPGKLYAGIGSNVYSTTDGGAHWSILAPSLSHPITFLLAVILPNGKTEVFASAGQIQRFPALVSSTDTLIGNVVTWGIAILLIGLAFYITRRNRRRLETNWFSRRRSEPPDGLPPI